ncbi:MAG: Fe-S cluster assembly protein SufD [Cyclobacteriaceae bacterium]
MSIAPDQHIEQLTDLFQEFEDQLNGAKESELHQIRREAMASFVKLGFPDKKNEEYKYTPTTRKIRELFDFKRFNRKESLQKSYNQYRINDLDGYVIFLVNGRLIGDLPDSNDKVTFETISPEGKDQLAKYVDYKKDAFAALNTAFTNKGISIKIADNAAIARPIIMYHLIEASEVEGYGQPRNLIVAGENSQATILEVFQTSGAHQSFINSVSEILVNAKASLDRYKIVNESGSSFHIGTTQVEQKVESQFNSYSFTLGGSLVRNNLNINLSGEHCETHMYGLYLLNGNSHVDNHTTVDHKIRNCFSNELYKGILDDNATGVFNGKIYVRPDAQKTNAFQSNKNILLSNDASMNTKPQLEIWADDVQCSHGATTGQLDDEQLFYLRSRGLSEARAKAMLLHAFASDVLDKVKIPALRTYLNDIVQERLEQTY